MAVTIKSAKTALFMLMHEDLTVDGAIAYGVLKLFVEQKEKQSQDAEIQKKL